MTTYTKTNAPLPILISSRIRLSEEQRQPLKDAYQSRKRQETVERATVTGISVATSQPSSLDAELGMSSLVVADLLASRDSMAIGIVLKFQEVLGVEVLTEKMLMDACKSYCRYVFSKEQ
jgi:hypothetical protein